MRHVTLQNYSTFYDLQTGVQFAPVLDRRSGCFVAVAQVDDKTAESFAARSAFDVLTAEEYLAMTSLPEEPAEEEPALSETGDPLGDAAGKAKQSAPPTPPQ